MAVISSQLPLKIIAIALCAMLLLSCKYACQEINQSKGIWKLKEVKIAGNDTFRPPDVLKFGDTTKCFINNKCELFISGKFVGQFTGGYKEYPSGNSEFRIHFPNMTDGVYIER